MNRLTRPPIVGDDSLDELFGRRLVAAYKAQEARTEAAVLAYLGRPRPRLLDPEAHAVASVAAQFRQPEVV